MGYPSFNGCCGREPRVDFDYGMLDGQELPGVDTEFWRAQGELLVDILRWLTTPRSLAGAGARCHVLSLYLNASIAGKSSLREIAAMPEAPTVAALSKAML